MSRVRVDINNLGLIPLAGVCDYEAACGLGYDIERNVDLLKRYVYVESQLTKIFAAHLANVPEWEVKCASSLHMWLDSEHSAALRKRVTEMREPPLYLDKVPDERLENLFNELIRSETTLELMVGIYGVIKPELIRCIKKHLKETNPLVDQPTCRVLKIMLMEEEEMLEWGEQAIVALSSVSEDAKKEAKTWSQHLQAFLFAADGISGDLDKPQDMAAPANPRTESGKPYVMKVEPKRDARFVDSYNSSADIDRYFTEEQRPPDERAYALIYKRLREMDVPEWMAPIIYKTEGKPWDYYKDLSRQLWDEARHSMLGEVGLYQHGVPFYKYPIEFKTSMVLNTKFDPFDAHIVLWYIEQSLMPKETGKRKEWEVAKQSDNELAITFQDYDWADEVLHAQIGRRWLLPEFENLNELKTAGKEIIYRNGQEKMKLNEKSDQKEWWSDFLTDIRQSREKVQKSLE